MSTIFISSTFQDMQQERDVLQDSVLPRVKELAKQYGKNIDLCDLRWGVNSSGMTEEESTAKVLQVCFDEIDNLLKNGLLTYFEDDETTVTISYKNEQVKKCLTKAGQALEMKIYTTAKALLDKDGVPVYDDALNGVVIDWDGELHDETVEEIYDTENEIDIMLMHDIVPVFISCKNGIVTADELYKLNTVAERFGGQYSKKVLVATSISAFGDQGMYLRQRAKDMNIKLIEGVQTLDDAELEKKLKNIWNN